MIGSGNYQWLDLNGDLQTSTHWDAIPKKIGRLVAFVPTAIPEPHTNEDHAIMDSFNDRLHEVMSRCQQ